MPLYPVANTKQRGVPEGTVLNHGGVVTHESENYFRSLEKIDEQKELMAVVGTGERYFNVEDPAQAIKTEKPWHRTAFMMAVNGVSQKDIAKELDKTECHISALLRQPWAQERMIEIQREAGGEALQEKMKRFAEQALENLDSIANDVDTPAPVKVTANMYLVNRFFGTPKASMSIDDSRAPKEMTDNELARALAATAKPKPFVNRVEALSDQPSTFEKPFPSADKIFEDV